MVVMILNIDDVYLQVKNENLKDLDAVNDEDRTLSKYNFSRRHHFNLVNFTFEINFI